MNPNDLRARVEQEVLAHVDTDAWEQHEGVEEAQQESVEKIADKMMEVVG